MIEFVIASPFPVAITLAIAGAAFGVSAVAFGYGIFWRLLLKPRLEARDDRYAVHLEKNSIKDQHISLLEQANAFLRTQLENQKHSEVYYYTEMLRKASDDKTDEIDQLRSKINTIDKTHSDEIARLSTSLTKLEEERDQLLTQIKESQKVIPVVSREFLSKEGVSLVIYNYTTIPKKIDIQFNDMWGLASIRQYSFTVAGSGEHRVDEPDGQ